MSPEDTPGYVEKFEFHLGENPEQRVYWVVRGGKAALKCLEGPEEGKYRLPHFGIVDGGYMSYLGATEGPLSKESKDSKSDYEAARDYLQLCRDAALAILNKKELWGIHIHDILEYYLAVKSQSDNILARTSEFHPEFEKYRLPEISDEDEERMKEVARNSLEHALLGLHG